LDDPIKLEEAISALREELLKDLAESLPHNSSMHDSFQENSDYLSI
tara:strand:+ start:158 stop:295 length:138 start_codon:yes stop_codon:yes gene_type:complete